MPKWTLEQALAIDKDNTNIIVSAGAGSGKTAVLTARVIRKLKDGVPINRLLVLTFTNEAAGEMKDRIRKAIKENEDLIDQLDYLDSSYITTFDSYALSILKKYHYVLGVSKNISIVDSSIINIKKREFIDKIFDDMYSSSDSDFLKFICDFCVKDDRDIKDEILKISASLDMRLDKTTFLKNYVSCFYNSNYVRSLVSSYIDNIFSIRNDIKNLLDEVLSSEESDVCDSYLLAFSPLISASNYSDIKNSLDIKFPRKVSDKDSKERLKELVNKLKEFVLYENEEYIYDSYMMTKSYALIITKIILLLDEMVFEYKKSVDSYEFIDISKMAIDIVKNNPDISDEIKYFYNEIMVDEYQDTNDLQEIFINQIANNNVYMVGDIKQSIYRFRNANPLIFKNKYDNYSALIDGFKIDLIKNFRSRSEVLFDINKIFDKIMDDFLGGALYKKSHRMVFGNKVYEENNDESISNFLSFYNYDPELNKNYSKDEIEAFIIAHDIKEKVKNGFTVLDKATNKLRPIRYDDFCIIMDRGSSFDLYKKIFEFENIPLVIYKDEVLNSSYDVLIIKNIIRFVIKIKKREFDQEFKYLFTSIARSYLFEFSDDYIFDCFVNNSFYKNDIYSISKEIADVLDEVSTNEFFDLVVDKFDFYKKMVKTSNVEGIMVRILYLKKLCGSLANLGFSPYDLGDYLDKLIDGGFELKYKLNNKVSGSVRIMNIHKSKGLEFPICYYSGLYKKFNIRDFNSRFMYDNKYGIITPYFDKGVGSLFVKSMARDLYIKEEISEKIRLLYVATTRAKEKMIFVAPFDDDVYNSDSFVSDDIRLKFRSFLDILNNVKDDFDSCMCNIDYLSFVSKDYHKFKSIRFDKITSGKKLSVKSVPVLYEEVMSSKFSKVNNKMLTSDELFVIKKGLDVHYLFEVSDFKNPKFDVKYGNYLKRFLESDLLKNVRAAKVFKEYEFFYKEDGDTYHGIIDLMLVYDDHIDIVDYKLSDVSDPLYIKQLKGYGDYISKKSLKNVNLYLYSIEKNTFKVIC